MRQWVSGEALEDAWPLESAES